MSYLTQSAIAGNMYMIQRVAQCAAEQHITDPDTWAGQHSREWAAAPDWDLAWESAVASHPTDDFPGYDPGQDEAVITDGMILAQVQSMIAAPKTEANT